MNLTKGNHFSITLNASKNYIFLHFFRMDEFWQFKVEYGKLDYFCLNILSNTTELEKRSKLMRPVWT